MLMSQDKYLQRRPSHKNTIKYTFISVLNIDIFTIFTFKEPIAQLKRIHYTLSEIYKKCLSSGIGTVTARYVKQPFNRNLRQPYHGS